MQELLYNHFKSDDALTKFVNEHEVDVVAIVPNLEFYCGTLGASGYNLFYREKEIVVTPQKPVLTIKPIPPEQAHTDFKSTLDPLMIQAVNNLLVLKGYAKYITLKQKDIISEYERLHHEKRTKPLNVFKTNQLEFEGIFRDAGWQVTYDKPGYNESYEPTFEFKFKNS